MEFVHTTITEHPLRKGVWVLFVPELPFIPPYVGSKKDCESRREHVELNAKKFLETNKK